MTNSTDDIRAHYFEAAYQPLINHAKQLRNNGHESLRAEILAFPGEPVRFHFSFIQNIVHGDDEECLYPDSFKLQYRELNFTHQQPGVLRKIWDSLPSIDRILHSPLDQNYVFRQDGETRIAALKGAILHPRQIDEAVHILEQWISAHTGNIFNPMPIRSGHTPLFLLRSLK